MMFPWFVFLMFGGYPGTGAAPAGNELEWGTGNELEWGTGTTLTWG